MSSGLPVTKAAYQGDGSTKAFKTPFVFTAAGDLLVYTISISTETLLKVLTTDYTVSGGSGGVGTVTFGTAPAATLVVLIVRKGPSQLATYDYLNTGDDDATVAARAAADYVKAVAAGGLASTDDLPEGVTNLYYTPARVDGEVASHFLDTDGTLAANSDSKIASQKATKTYADTKLATATAASTYIPGPGTVTSGHFVSFSGTTGLVVADSGSSASSFDAAGAAASAITTAESYADTHKIAGPGAVTDSHVVMFSGTTGLVVKDSGLTLSGSNTGDQTITLTNDVTGTGTGSFAATIAAHAVTYAKMQATSQAALLGASSATTITEITAGSGLSLSGTTLSVTSGTSGGLVGDTARTLAASREPIADVCVVVNRYYSLTTFSLTLDYGADLVIG